MDTPLVEFRHVRKHYIPYEYHLNIYKNEVILLQGENGKGKTTLIHLLLKFTKPDQGEIIQNKLAVSYVSEEQQLPIFMKGHTYLKELARIKKGTIDYELIKRLQVPINQTIKTLSRGNRQKLILIGSFIGRSDMLIMDEPTHGLDQGSIEILIDYLKQVITDITLIIISHEGHYFEPLNPRLIQL